MKTPNPAAMAAVSLIIAGALFFSCARGIDSCGTLVIRLPGSDSASRAAVSPGFTATLTYHIRCSGPGSVIREAKSGSDVSLLLNEGDWTVTITVLNAAGLSIGSGTAAVIIENGKTTLVQIPVGIDTSGNSITSFAITSPPAEGKINAAEDTIEVYVPFGTNVTGMDFSVIHTGAAITPSPGAPQNFASPRIFTVTAENSITRNYTVRVNISEQPGIPNEPLPAVPGGVWPEDAIWRLYGLAGIRQPAATRIISVENTQGELIVRLSNADRESLDNIAKQVESRFSKTGTFPSGDYLYVLQYTYSSKIYTLTLAHNSTTSALNLMITETG
jgi:hypothetical protein